MKLDQSMQGKVEHFCEFFRIFPPVIRFLAIYLLAEATKTFNKQPRTQGKQHSKTTARTTFLTWLKTPSLSRTTCSATPFSWSWNKFWNISPSQNFGFRKLTRKARQVARHQFRLGFSSSSINRCFSSWTRFRRTVSSSWFRDIRTRPRCWLFHLAALNSVHRKTLNIPSKFN